MTARFRVCWRKLATAGLVGDMTRMEFNIRFTLDNPHVNTLLVGTTNMGHLQDNVSAVLKGPLPAAVRDAALEALAPHGTRV